MKTLLMEPISKMVSPSSLRGSLFGRAAVGDNSAAGRLKHAHYDAYALSLLVDAIGQDLISASEGRVVNGARAHATAAIREITNSSPTRQFQMGCS